MTDAVDVLANSIRMNPRTFGAGRLAELYIQAMRRAGYVIIPAESPQDEPEDGADVAP